MSALTDFKLQLTDAFSNAVEPLLADIISSGGDHRQQAIRANALVAQKRAELVAECQGKELSRQNELIVLEYCSAVASLEYRNRVWPYEYMALSRRMGELWERFCKAAWECPVRNDVARVEPPRFQEVLKAIHDRLTPQVPEDVRDDLDNLISLVAPISMIEDEVFSVDGQLHVIDFKSGFSSNEKGNTERLLAVGRAYRLFDENSVLLFLVRQEQNNNYLNAIRKSGLWEVSTGRAAYEKIDELTGSSITQIREELIDFKTDLSQKFWKPMEGSLADLEKYFVW